MLGFIIEQLGNYASNITVLAQQQWAKEELNPKMFYLMSGWDCVPPAGL